MCFGSGGTLWRWSVRVVDMIRQVSEPLLLVAWQSNAQPVHTLIEICPKTGNKPDPLCEFLCHYLLAYLPNEFTQVSLHIVYFCRCQFQAQGQRSGPEGRRIDARLGPLCWGVRVSSFHCKLCRSTRGKYVFSLFSNLWDKSSSIDQYVWVRARCDRQGTDTVHTRLCRLGYRYRYLLSACTCTEERRWRPAERREVRRIHEFNPLLVLTSSFQILQHGLHHLRRPCRHYVALDLYHIRHRLSMVAELSQTHVWIPRTHENQAKHEGRSRYSQLAHHWTWSEV